MSRPFPTASNHVSYPVRHDGAAALVGGAYAILLLVAFFPFIDPLFAFNFEFDTPIYNQYVRSFRTFFSTFAFSDLHRLVAWPPYLDTPYLVYTLVAVLVGGITDQLAAWGIHLDTGDAVIVFSIRIVNYLGIVGAGVLMYAAVYAVSGRIAISVGLAAIYSLSPILYQIDLTRLDHLLELLLVAGLYLGVRIARGSDRRIDFVLLGLVCALLMTTKISSLSFGMLLVAATVLARRNRRGFARDVLWMWSLAAAAGVLLSFRFLYNWQIFIPNLVSQITHQLRWKVLVPQPSFLFFGWEAFNLTGVLFRYLMWAGFAVSIVLALVRRDRVAALVAVLLATFLFLSLFTYANPRGGYHLVPMFVLAVAVLLTEVDRWIGSLPRSRSRAFASVALPLILLAEPIAAGIPPLLVARTIAAARPDGVERTRLQPARWIAEAFPAGTRIAQSPSGPHRLPLDPKFAIDLNFLEMSPIDAATLRDALPITSEETRARFDLFIVTDGGEKLIYQRMENNGLEEIAAAWRSYFDMLRATFPSVTFTADHEAYFATATTVWLINSPMSHDELERSVAAFARTPILSFPGRQPPDREGTPAQ